MRHIVQVVHHVITGGKDFSTACIACKQSLDEKKAISWHVKVVVSPVWYGYLHACTHTFVGIIINTVLQHFTSTLAVTSHQINACPVFVQRCLSMLHVKRGSMPARSLERKGRRCNVTPKVLVKCPIRKSSHLSCLTKCVSTAYAVVIISGVSKKVWCRKLQ